MQIEVTELKEEHTLVGFFETLHSFRSAEKLSIFDARRIFWLINQNKFHKVYVALSEGRVVGTATLLVRSTLLHSRLIGYVEDMAVHESCSGKGVFRQIMEFVEAKAREFNCYKIILNCEPDNEPKYIHLGFRKCDVGLRKDL